MKPEITGPQPAPETNNQPSIVSPQPIAPWAQPAAEQPVQPAGQSVGIPIKVTVGGPSSPETQANPEPITLAQPQAVAPIAQQPASPAFQPIVPEATGSKKPVAVALSLCLVVAAALGGVLAMGALSHGQEAQVGAAYIKAIQSKDYAALDNLSAPETVKVADKIGAAGGEESKAGFYKSVVSAMGSGSQLSGSDAEKVKVTKDSADGVDYAYVTYKIGNKNATVLEAYNGSVPRVVSIDKGVAYYSASQFKSDYSSYKHTMQSMGKMVDQIAQAPGGTGKQTIKTIFATE